MERTRMVRGLPFPAILPNDRMTNMEAKSLVDRMRQEAADTPEMTLDEINAEISLFYGIKELLRNNPSAEEANCRRNCGNQLNESDISW